jgi:hypothetical protein
MQPSVVHRYNIRHIIERNQDGSPRIRTTEKPMFFDVNFEERYAIWRPGTEREEAHTNLGPEMTWESHGSNGARPLIYVIIPGDTIDTMRIERYKNHRGRRVLVAEEIYDRVSSR